MSLNETPSTPQVITPGNPVRQEFRELVAHFQISPLEPQVETCAANLAAYLASGYGVCIGVVSNAQLHHLDGVLTLLAGYGIVGRRKYFQGAGKWAIFLAVELPRIDYLPEWDGAVVSAFTNRVTAAAA